MSIYGGDTPSGANYFFGFLIAFVGLLIIFVACGIGSRRRFTARREAGLHHDGTMRRYPNGTWGGEGPPQFYEYSFVIGESGWNSLMPLSVIFWREEEKESSAVEHDLQTLPPATPARRNIFCRILPRRHRDENPSLPARTDPEPPDTIQVAVMIVMPRDPSLETYDHESKGSECLPEYQIGAIKLPWQEQVT